MEDSSTSGGITSRDGGRHMGFRLSNYNYGMILKKKKSLFYTWQQYTGLCAERLMEILIFLEAYF